jgi:hypothetical protein
MSRMSDEARADMAGPPPPQQEPMRVAPVLSYHQPQPLEVRPSTAIVSWFGVGMATTAFTCLAWRGGHSSAIAIVVFALMITGVGMLLFHMGVRDRLRWGGPRHFTLAIASGAAYVAGLLVVAELTTARFALLWFAIAIVHGCGFPLAASLWTVGRAGRSAAS